MTSEPRVDLLDAASVMDGLADQLHALRPVQAESLRQFAKELRDYVRLFSRWPFRPPHLSERIGAYRDLVEKP